MFSSRLICAFCSRPSLENSIVSVMPVFSLVSTGAFWWSSCRGVSAQASALRPNLLPFKSLGNAAWEWRLGSPKCASGSYSCGGKRVWVKSECFGSCAGTHAPPTTFKLNPFITHIFSFLLSGSLTAWRVLHSLNSCSKVIEVFWIIHRWQGVLKLNWRFRESADTYNWMGQQRLPWLD